MYELRGNHFSDEGKLKCNVREEIPSFNKEFYVTDTERFT